MRWTVLLLIAASDIAFCRPQSQPNASPPVEAFPKITLLPYYGGAKGQSLRIAELGNGAVTKTIVNNSNLEPSKRESSDENEPNEIESSPEVFSYSLSENLKLLQNTAMKIVQLEEKSKTNGELSEEEEETYKKHMNILNRTAARLAALQEEANPIEIENREGLSAWFERTKTSKSKNKKKEDEDKKKKEEEKKRKEEEDKKKKKEEEDRKKKQEEEENKRKEQENKRKGEKEEEEEGELGGDDDSVAVNLPPEDASVAEAKPVGLAIAGEGGVASSKPVGTAVAGPGGLAIARPVATAIAGVPPDDAWAPLYGGISVSKPNKTKDKGSLGGANEYLSKLLKKYHEN